MALVPVHGRDHCPGGPDEIPCLATSYPYIFREKTGTQVIASGAPSSVLTFDATTNEGADYFDTISSSVTRIISRGAATNGIFVFTAQLKWETMFAGKTGLSITCGAFGWDVGIFWEEPGGASGGDAIAPVLDFRRRIDTAANSEIRLKVEQWSGSDKTLLSAFLEVAFLGSFVGTGNSF